MLLGINALTLVHTFTHHWHGRFAIWTSTLSLSVSCPFCSFCRHWLDEQRNMNSFDGPTAFVFRDFCPIIINVMWLSRQTINTCPFPIHHVCENFMEFLMPWFSFLPFWETFFFLFYFLQPLSLKSEALKNSQLHLGKFSLLRSINGWFCLS